ncbi:MAG: adenine phosphoribosyltransferase [Streptosporangiales bacterium]|nr:adenine phosphoribosyltransferase [Streptosporangiales bacterium]
MTERIDAPPAAPDAPLAERIARGIRVIPDFPEPGIAFQDLCGVFGTPELLRGIAAEMAGGCAGGFDRVLAVEARGFVLGTAVALHSGRPLVLARKRGKLPGAVHAASYQLEYGSGVLEVQRTALAAADRVLVVDDVLATGGTLAAAGELVTRAGAEVAGYAVVLAITALHGDRRLHPTPLHTLLPV